MEETKKCIQTSRKLVRAITEKSNNPDASIIDKMDQLSDELCRVADLAECMRQIHPDSEVSYAAQESCMAINSYVEELNTDFGLYTALRKLMDSDTFSSLDDVTKRTTEVFMHDFEISGIHLKESIRREVVDLNYSLLELGFRFSLDTTAPTLVHGGGHLPGLEDHYQVDDTGSLCIDHVPTSSTDSKLRKSGYLLYYATDLNKTKVFEEMVVKRQRLSQLVGCRSYAHRVLKMSMAESPEIVLDFLEALSERVLPLAREDVKILGGRRREELKGCFNEEGKGQDIGPWDIPILVSRVKRRCLPPEMKEVRNWFSLPACIEGLRNLFSCLFGVRLEVMPVKNGEVWHQNVLKFGFFDQGGGLLGYTYGDLVHRENRLASDCHFTIRGGREVLLDKENGRDMLGYQIPIITLCCSAEQPMETGLSLLSQQSVETLFHEMGHALHSMLGQAKYQNVTGTRCSTDFAEVPSTLMEFFLGDKRVVSSFAKNYLTGEALPPSLMEGFQLSTHFFAAYDTQIQITNAIMDQKFHSEYSFPADRTGWSMEIYKDITEKYSPISYVPNTAYYLRFSHLCAYGGRYYSYLWSRAVASLIWKSSFFEDPFSRASGENYRTMLRYGGGLDPKLLVREMLGFEPTVDQLVDALFKDILGHRKKVANALQHT